MSAAFEACDVEPHAVSAARALLPGAIVHHGGPETMGPAWTA
jgi:hypothetical protein